MNPLGNSMGVAIPSALKNHTHEKLVAHALEVASPILMGNEETALVKETIFNVAAAINSAFEQKKVENLIGAYFDLSSDPDCSQQAWEEGLDEVAGEFALIASKAAMDVVKHSPIMEMGQPTLGPFLNGIFETVKSDVVALKHDHGKPRSSL
jgi:hypothetical protein